MTNESRQARLAGLVYLVVVITGIFSMVYVAGKLAAPGNPQTVLANIVLHEPLFRAGIAAFIVEQMAFVLLPLLLFRLLHRVHRPAAVAMVALALTAVPIALVGVTYRLDALWLLTDNAGLPTAIAHAMASSSLQSYAHAIFVASLFWGLWLAPFGYLVFKSGMLPRPLGVLLMLGCVGYLIDVFAALLWPGYTDTAFSSYVNLPSAVAEIGTCLWLLLMGARVDGRRERAGLLRNAA